MADNLALPAVTGKAGTRETIYSGETVHMEAVGLVLFSGADDAKSATDVSATNPLPVATAANTGTTSQVSTNAASVTLLSADATRKGFRVWNDSSQALYLKFGTTATITDCTVRIPQDGYLEENYYNGRVDGIWGAAGTGAARITALT